MPAVPCSEYLRRRQRCALFLDIRAISSERLKCSPSFLAWRMDKQGHPHPGSDSSEERRSQCRQLRHQTTSFRYRTTRPSRSWSAHRAEHQAIFSSTPILKMILNRFLTLRSELRLTERCSRNYSNECAESRSILESMSRDHRSVRGHELT